MLSLLTPKQWSCCFRALLILAAFPALGESSSITDFGSIQEAVDHCAGEMLYVPAGIHEIDQAITIREDGSGLFGPGTILQKNPAAHILVIEEADDVRIHEVTLTRAEGAQDTTAVAIRAENAVGLCIRDVRVIENRSANACIHAIRCRETQIKDCLIRNYKTPTIDDRTKQELYGGAFRAVDGTGIKFFHSQGIEIVGNRIIEERFIPTKEMRDQYELGKLTVKPEKPGALMPQEEFDRSYTPNWHQGAAVLIADAEDTERVIIRGNYFENAAQGLDIHGDRVIVADNMIYRAMIGMKALHGAKNVLINGNHFSHCDLWGLLLMPGHDSQGPRLDAEGINRQPNVDGGTIVSNNLFSDFGYGGQYWNWADRTPEYPERNVIAILFGPLEQNPPLRNVLVTGNLVYNSAAEGVLEGDEVQHPEPRYDYALYLETQREPKPVNIKIEHNLFDAGRKGVSNVGL